MSGLDEFRNQWLQELKPVAEYTNPNGISKSSGSTSATAVDKEPGKDVGNIEIYLDPLKNSFVAAENSKAGTNRPDSDTSFQALNVGFDPNTIKRTMKDPISNQSFDKHNLSTRSVSDINYIDKFGDKRPWAFYITEQLLQGKVPCNSKLFQSKENNINENAYESIDKWYKTICDQSTVNKRSALSVITHDVPKKTKKDAFGKDCLIDVLIHDLDDINDIPFFDITLPKEVAIKIFQCLGIEDLCSCAQVSKSWRSIAEDDLLWYRLYCYSGYGNDTTAPVHSVQNWKGFLRDTIVREQTLRQNWKNRIGRLYELEDSRAGILCSAYSCPGFIVTGYYGGRLNLWRLREDGIDDYLTILDPDHDSRSRGLGSVTCVAVNQDFVVAGFDHGLVYTPISDIASKTVLPSEAPVTVVKMFEKGCIFAASSSSRVQVFSPNFEERSLTLQHETKVGHLSVSSLSNSEAFGVAVATDTVIRMHRCSSKEDISYVLHHLIGSTVTCLDSCGEVLGAGITDRTAVNVFQIPLYSLTDGHLIGNLASHTSAVLCLDLHNTPVHLIASGCRDKRARVFDMRTLKAEISISAHSRGVSQIQMDENRLVTGGEDGFVCVWDLRTRAKLWEMRNRHPVKYLRCEKTTLVTANIPDEKCPEPEDGELVVHRRQRGTVRVYDFSADQQTKGVPSICLSSYNEPTGYNYNIRLAVPYDEIRGFCS
ncbi:F-box/WD repeat-containing protein 8-like [Limulus polyphemus]|uniref:F-box/WD repeat-containing protein 8-like n=1 Tax=Limulus polyphemus TaxID=6850 RepID=A0ABM1BE16_LIMPO|nr:F-box/WD repeat-containing protein 8-like [Limulus polyphemus]